MLPSVLQGHALVASDVVIFAIAAGDAYVRSMPLLSDDAGEDVLVRVVLEDIFPSLGKDQSVLALASWRMAPPFPDVPVDFNIASGRGTGLVPGRDAVHILQVKVLVGKDHDHVECPCDHPGNTAAPCNQSPSLPT